MSANTTGRLIALLERLEREPGSIALMAEVDLELLAEMDCSALPPTFPRCECAYSCHVTPTLSYQV